MEGERLDRTTVLRVELVAVEATCQTEQGAES
jgi:hypothetical protein